MQVCTEKQTEAQWTLFWAFTCGSQRTLQQFKVRAFLQPFSFGRWDSHPASPLPVPSHSFGSCQFCLWMTVAGSQAMSPSPPTAPSSDGITFWCSFDRLSLVRQGLSPGRRLFWVLTTQRILFFQVLELSYHLLVGTQWLRERPTHLLSNLHICQPASTSQLG